MEHSRYVSELYCYLYSTHILLYFAFGCVILQYIMYFTSLYNYVLVACVLLLGLRLLLITPILMKGRFHLELSKYLLELFGITTFFKCIPSPFIAVTNSLLISNTLQYCPCLLIHHTSIDISVMYCLLFTVLPLVFCTASCLLYRLLLTVPPRVYCPALSCVSFLQTEEAWIVTTETPGSTQMTRVTTCSR